MIALFLELSKYVLVMLMALYITSAFVALKRRDDDFRRGIYIWLELLALAVYSVGIANVWFRDLMASDPEALRMVTFLGIAEFILLIFYPMIFRALHRDTHRLLLCQTGRC